jgi:hypothetical protein
MTIDDKVGFWKKTALGLGLAGLAGLAAVGLWPDSQERGMSQDRINYSAPDSFPPRPAHNPIKLTDVVEEDIPRAPVVEMSQEVIQPSTKVEEVVGVQDKLEAKVYRFTQVNPGEQRYKLVEEIAPWGTVRIEIDGVKITYTGLPKSWDEFVVYTPEWLMEFAEKGNPYTGAETQEDILLVAYELYKEGLAQPATFEGYIRLLELTRFLPDYEKIKTDKDYCFQYLEGGKIFSVTGMAKEAYNQLLGEIEQHGFEAESTYRAYESFEITLLAAREEVGMIAGTINETTHSLNSKPLLVGQGDNIYLILAARGRDIEGNEENHFTIYDQNGIAVLSDNSHAYTGFRDIFFEEVKGKLNALFVSNHMYQDGKRLSVLVEGYTFGDGESQSEHSYHLGDIYLLYGNSSIHTQAVRYNLADDTVDVVIIEETPNGSKIETTITTNPVGAQEASRH